jgi:hypothetical protein
MLFEIGAIVLAVVIVNIVFWLIVLRYKRSSERLQPIVIDDEGKQIFHSKKAFYHGTFDIENFRIFSNGLFAKGRGSMKLTDKYLMFCKKFSKRNIIIPLRYILTLSTAPHPKKMDKPMLKVHWQNGNVELISNFALADEERPEAWIKKIGEVRQ